MGKKALKSLVLFLILSYPLSANGGIHWWRNGTGAEPAVITLKNDPEINLKKENLTLRFVDDSVIVTCDYVLSSKSKKDKEIDFAFNLTNAWESTTLYYYNIFAGGKRLQSELYREVIHDEIDLCNYWELSKIKVAANKETQISVCYRIETTNDGVYYGNDFSDNSFVYNMYPALSFGNGIIEEFTLTLDASDITGYNGRITKISGADIKIDGNQRTVTRTFKNFDLNKHKKLEVSYNIKNYYFSKLYGKYGQWLMYDATATSELKEGNTVYSAEKLMDNDCNTAWSEGKSGSGINERIKIQIEGVVTQILLVNGFRKSSKTYYENNRVKKIALYVDGIRLGEMTFPDRPFHKVTMSNILDEGELLNLGNFFEGNSEKTFPGKSFHCNSDIEIEILDVYPGTKYDDTCISDIYLIKAPLPIP